MEDDPTYEIAIAHVGGHEAINAQRLDDVIEAALRRHATPGAKISVALVGDSDIAQLNEHHLDHKGPTDVLTFDLTDDSPPSGGPRPALEGEIVLSLDTAAREAQRRGHDTASEAALYAVHGTLHLLGYDDANDADASTMHRVEDELLATVGIGPVYGVNGP